jgi:hypothetical protein
VRDLRVHRTHPREVELGVEAIGAFIGARSAGDACQVGEPAAVVDAVRRAGECGDATVDALGATSILDATRTESST